MFVNHGASCGDRSQMFRGARTVGSLVFQGSLPDFVCDPATKRRGIALAPSLHHPPASCVLAAMLGGARLQADLLGQAIRYEAPARHVFACTPEITQVAAEAWALVKAACTVPGSTCRHVTFTHAVELLNKAARERPRAKPWQRITIFIVGAADSRLTEVTAGVKSALRTFTDFINQFGKIATMQ